MPQQPCAKNFSAEFQPKRGFATLLAILVVFAIGITAAVFSLSLSVGSSRIAIDLKHSSDARSLADLCAESGIRKIIDTPDYTGTENLSFSQGDCSYSVGSTSDGGTISWQIDAIGTSSGFMRKVRTALSATVPVPPTLPAPLPDSWQEVAAFD